MHSVEMNISILQQSQVRSKPDLQPAAVKNPKFRKGRQSWEKLLGGNSISPWADEVSQNYIKDMKKKFEITAISEYFSLKDKDL